MQPSIAEGHRTTKDHRPQRKDNDKMTNREVLNEIAWRVSKLKEGHGKQDAIDALDNLWVYLYQQFDVRGSKP